MILLTRKEAVSLGQEVLVEEEVEMNVTVRETETVNIKVADHILALTADADTRDTEVTGLSQEREMVTEKEKEREEDPDHLEREIEEIKIDMIGIEIGNIEIETTETTEIIGIRRRQGDLRKRKKISERRS